MTSQLISLAYFSEQWPETWLHPLREPLIFSHDPRRRDSGDHPELGGIGRLVWVLEVDGFGVWCVEEDGRVGEGWCV